MELILQILQNFLAKKDVTNKESVPKIKKKINYQKLTRNKNECLI